MSKAKADTAGKKAKRKRVKLDDQDFEQAQAQVPTQAQIQAQAQQDLDDGRRLFEGHGIIRLKRITNAIKLGPTERDQIISDIAQGVSKVVACRRLGITLDTLGNYSKRFPEFARDLDRADAECEYRHATWWNRRGEEWRASKEFLAQKYWKDWAKRDAPPPNDDQEPDPDERFL